MIACTNRFWLGQPSELLCNPSIIPTNTMSLEDQMNTVTRLVFLIFLVLLIFSTKYSFIFFLLANILIIILYYIQRKKMQTLENFNACPPLCGKPATQQDYFNHKGIDLVKQRNGSEKIVMNQPSAYLFCNDGVDNLAANNKVSSNYESIN